MDLRKVFKNLLFSLTALLIVLGIGQNSFAAEKAGINPPESEDVEYTNFIH